MTRPFETSDLELHRKVVDVHCTAAAPAAVCTVRSVDRAQDSYRQTLWLLPLDGGAPQQLGGDGSGQSPRWSPQGDRIAFLSSASGSMQVHLIDPDGSGVRQCGQLPGAVSSLRWATDGKSLLVTAAVSVDPDRHGKRGPAGASGPTTPEVAWKLPYKSDGMGYLLRREIHLFRIDVEKGDHEQLTDGNFDVFSFVPSPDGRQVAYGRTREGRFAHRTDLWLCDADGGRARQLTRDFATVLQPSWSPDGSKLAFAAAQQEGSAQNALYVLDAATGRMSQLGDDNLEVADGMSVHWSADGERVVFTRAWHGCHEVCAIPAAGGELQVLVAGERQFGAFCGDGERFVFSVDHPAEPNELWTCEADGQHERRLSDFNPWWRERTPLVAEHREFTVPDGEGGRETIEGWLIRARDVQGPQPLVDDVHGGPASYALLDFETNVYWQVLCSRGWAILALNTVGSASQGREFCERLNGRWGELDLPQHLEVVRQLQDDGTCDKRVGIVGKSYGGFLSAWAVGHTQLFRSAVVMAPVGNIETHYGTSDGGYYADPLYVGSKPRFDRHRARELSPLQHIEKSKTPVLFLQGKDDERCPKCQSEEMFVSLMRAGDTPAELVLYPGGDHHFLSDGAPSMRRDACERIMDWLARWCERPAPAAKAEQREEVSES
ncbi:S9 family peptidase [Ramlibacter algicola]|uniref:S9 family peptidase n=1 Tax=Ramlibacter algicola TaxID=2795217 RepID=A0A934Q0Q0_9BURK|nr:S9 family peptidase [Ramlibacter algicola]MBK0392492.1 S9 family peptidase [Ramlibacter algicola]